MEKLAYVQVHVPYKSAGNVIRQHEVSFEVFKDTQYYSLKPMLSEAERRLANLPESLEFSLVEGKAISSRGHKDGNLHVIQDAVQRLQERCLLG